MHTKVDLIGSNGTIGKVISEYLESQGVIVRKITRKPSVDSLVFSDYLTVTKNELIIDVSLMSIQNSLDLRQSLENSKSRLIHMSSVSVFHDNNQYGQYKRSIYRALHGYENSEIYFGDVFEGNGKILGFWKKLNTSSTWIYSFRSVRLFNIEHLCECLLNEKRYNPEIIKTRSIKKSLVSIIFKTRLFKILNLLGIYVVK